MKNRHLHFLVLASAILLACPCFGLQFQVSESGQAYTKDPSILALRDGGFLVTWTGTTVVASDYDADGIDYDVYAKIYNSNGTVRTSQFIINDIKISKQWSPKPVQLPNGKIRVFWLSYVNNQTMTYDGTKYVYRCLFNPYGTKEEDDYQMYGGQFQSLSSLVLLKDGRVAVFDAPAYLLLLSDLRLTTFRTIFSDGSYPISSIVPLGTGGLMAFKTSQVFGTNTESARKVETFIFDLEGNIERSFDVSPSYYYSTSLEIRTATLPSGDILVVWDARPKNVYGIEQISINGVILSQYGAVVKPEFVITNITQGYWFVFPNEIMITVSNNGEFLVSWCHDKEYLEADLKYGYPTGSSGRQYNADYTPKDDATTLIKTKIGFKDMSLTSMNNGSFLAGRQERTGRLLARVAPPGYDDEDITSNSTDSHNIGLIVGVSVACVLIFLLVCCYGMKYLKNKRNEKLQKMALAAKGNNTTIVEILNPDKDIEPIVPQDQKAQMVEDIDIHVLPTNNPRLINFVGSAEDKSVPRQSDGMNFAPELNAQDTKDFVMDGRLAKPFMNKSFQPSLDRGSSDEQLIQEANETDGLKFGPQIDPSTLRTYVLDGRLAKGELLNMAQQNSQKEDMPVYKNQREDLLHNQEQGDSEEEERVENLFDLQKREREEEKEKEEENPLSVEDLFDAEKRERGSGIEVDNQNGDKKDMRDKLCIVCSTKPSEMAFLDCMHVCTCQTCSVELTSSTNRCPICREVIRDVKKIYVTGV